MLEPSNPIPSSNNSTVSSLVEMEKCCHNPGKSTNLRSTISTLFSLANASTSFGFITQGLLFDSIVRDGCGKGAENGRAQYAPLEACSTKLLISSPAWKRECQVCSSPRSFR